jgi:protein TonB
MQRRVQELEAAQQRMLTQAKSLRSVAESQNASEQPAPVPNVSGFDLAESARAMARLEGEISKSTDEYSKRPRKKFIGARAEEYRFAQYIEDWRQKIERIGTLNYPPAARGKLYGSLLLTVSINSDGTVTRIDINRSSGYKVLDDSARRIVQMASPYAAFPPDIRRDTDVIEITRTWYYTQGDQLSAK